MTISDITNTECEFNLRQIHDKLRCKTLEINLSTSVTISAITNTECEFNLRQIHDKLRCKKSTYSLLNVFLLSFTRPEFRMTNWLQLTGSSGLSLLELKPMKEATGKKP